MKRHLFFFCLLAIEVVLLAILHGPRRERPADQGAGGDPALAAARVLQVTDLAIWTEARYTRHPSQADFFSPFQDFPASLDHFPAGSLVAPPHRRPGGNRP